MRNQLSFETGGSVRFRIFLATIGFGFGPALFTIGEILHHQLSSIPILGPTLACFGLYLWIPGILGKVHLLRPTADRLGLFGGAVAFLGLVAVTNIMLLQLVFALIEQKAENYPEVIAGVFHNVLLVTYLFGPLFPLGLFLLGIGLHRLRIFPSSATCAFLLGAILFPVGRIAGLPPLIHLADLILTIGSAGIAWHLWKHSDLWTRPPSD